MRVLLDVWARPPIFVAALLSIASFTSPASAAERCSRDDVAALHQYCEQLPGAEGPTAVEGVAGSLRETLAPSVRRRLQQSGPEGIALLALPLGMAPAPGAPRGPLPGASGAVSGSLADPEDGGGMVVRAVGAIAGPGLSGVFRWALVLSTLFVAGIAWIRRRT
jgi:hypothetical protein